MGETCSCPTTPRSGSFSTFPDNESLPSKAPSLNLGPDVLESEPGEYSSADDNRSGNEDGNSEPSDAKARKVLNLSEELGMSSVGSVDHGSGKCKPCAFFHSDPQGCANGRECMFCHMCPPGMR